MSKPAERFASRGDPKHTGTRDEVQQPEPKTTTPKSLNCSNHEGQQLLCGVSPGIAKVVLRVKAAHHKEHASFHPIPLHPKACAAGSASDAYWKRVSIYPAPQVLVPRVFRVWTPQWAVCTHLPMKYESTHGKKAKGPWAAQSARKLWKSVYTLGRFLRLSAKSFSLSLSLSLSFPAPSAGLKPI